MPSRYQYAVIRYLPNVVRDEAVNVGIVVRGIEGVPIKTRFLPRSATVRKLWPDADQNLVVHFERQINRAIVQDEEFGKVGRVSEQAFFERASYEFNGNIQLSQPRGFRAESIEIAVKELYETFVAEPKGGPRPINYQSIAPYTMRTRIWTAFERRRLIGSGLVRRSPVLEGRHAPWTFDLGYQNGHINVISALALNASAKETNLGRALVFKGMMDEVREKNGQEIKGSAVVQLPAEERLGPDSKQAVLILQDADIRVFNLQQLEELIQEVKKELDSN